MFTFSILFLFIIFPTISPFGGQHMKQVNFETDVIFEQNINCKIQEYWFYKIRYYEADNFSWTHDEMRTTQEYHFRGQNNRTDWSRNMLKGGDADYTTPNNYEIRAEFTHNCTTDGKTKIYTYQFEDVAITTEKITLYLNLTMDDKENNIE